MINNARNIVICLCMCTFSTALCNATAEASGQDNNNLQIQQEHPSNQEKALDANYQGSAQQNSAIIIEKTGEQTQVRMNTKGHVTPYLGASKETPPSAEAIHMMSKEERDKRLKNFYLETGIRANVDKNINVDLGYRFEQTPSLTNEREQDNGQIQFGIHFKY